MVGGVTDVASGFSRTEPSRVTTTATINTHTDATGTSTHGRVHTGRRTSSPAPSAIRFDTRRASDASGGAAVIDLATSSTRSSKRSNITYGLAPRAAL